MREYDTISYLKKISLDDVSVSEKDKNKKEYLMAMTDYLISSLVDPKKEERVRKCRNLYDGKRDLDEFKYLEDFYGVTAASTLKMTPIVKPRVNALIGSMLNQTIRYIVSYNDAKSIDRANQERKDKHLKEVESLLTLQLQHNEKSLNNSKQPENKYFGKQTISRIKRSYSKNFISDIEKSAYHLLSFFENSPSIDFKRKKEQLCEDLVVVGETNYRVYKSELSVDPIFEVLKPENTFFNINTNDFDLSKCTAVVHREFLNRTQILYKYGAYMDKDTRERLYSDTKEIMLGYSINDSVTPFNSNNDLDRRQHTKYDSDVLEVFHVEWIANNKISDSGSDGKYKWRQDRYSAIRIGTDIYLNMGKDDNLVRSISEPWKAKLTYNGTIFKGRNGEAHSVAMSLKDAQDLYDLMIFFRDNLLASSGADASRINIAAIPKELGDTFMERLLKFLELRKTAAVELIDITEEGAEKFQHYGSSKNSVDPNLIISIDTILKSIENQADIIAGTNPQMIGQIAQKDAVENVKVGINQVAMINNSLFLSETELLKSAFIDLLNVGKVCYKKGKKGSYILGNANCLFELNPKNFVYTDYTITIADSSREIKKLESLKALITELAGSGMVPPEVIIKASTLDSPTEINELIEDAMIEFKQEQSQLGQMQQQLEQDKQQIDQLSKQLEKANSQITGEQGNSIKAEELKLKAKEVDANISNNKRKLDIEENFKLQELALKKETVKLERDQLYAPEGTVPGNAREIKNDI